MLPSVIRLKYAVCFLLLAAIPAFIIGIISYRNAASAVEAEALDRLATIADSKEAEIVEFLNQKRGRATDFASDGFIRDEVERMGALGSFSAELAANQALNEHLKNAKFPLDKDLTDLHIYDLSGNLIGGTEPEDFNGDPQKHAGQPFFIKAREGNPYIQNMSNLEGKATLAIGAPIRSRATNQIIGVLMNGYSLEVINNLLSGHRAFQLGVRPTTRMADLSRGIFLANPDNKIFGAAGRINHIGYLDNEAVLNCLGIGEEVSRESISSSGRVVLTASLCPRVEKDWQWILMVEEDKEEALRPITSFGKILLGSGLLVLALCVLAAWLLAHHISRKTTVHSEKPVQKKDIRVSDVER